MNIPVIDIHPHVISTDVNRYPRAPLGGHQSAWSEERPVGVEQLIVEQDRAGIRKAALVQASTCYGHDNSYVADAVEAHPDRFTGVFSCDILAPDACDTMAHWMARGLTGLRLFTTGSTMPGQAGWLDDPRSFPAWRKAEEMRLPVCLQMTADGIPQIENVLRRFPGLRVVLDHLARPVQEDGPPYEAADSLWRLATVSRRLPQGHRAELRGRRRRERPRRKRSSDGSSPNSARRALRGARTFPPRSARCPTFSPWRRTRLRFLPETDREWIFSRTAQTLYPALANRRMTRDRRRHPSRCTRCSANHAGTEALKAGRVTSPLVAFDYADVKVVNTQFKALMRELKYDFAEVAIVTYLQGYEYGKPYVLLPATIERPQSASHDLLQRGPRPLDARES